MNRKATDAADGDAASLPLPQLGLPGTKPKRVRLRGSPAALLVDHEAIFAT